MTIWDFWRQQNWGCDKKGNCNYARECVRINVREYVTIVRLRVRIQVWLHVRIHVKLCLSLHIRVVSLCQNMYIYYICRFNVDDIYIYMYIYIWYTNRIYIYDTYIYIYNARIRVTTVRFNSAREYMSDKRVRVCTCHELCHVRLWYHNMSLLCHLWWGSHEVNWFRCLWLTLRQPQGIGASPERCLVRRDGHLMGQRVTGHD